jgi:WD40 repeat protein
MWSLGEITFRLITKQPVFKNNGLLARYAMQSDPFPSADLLTHNVSTSGRDFISSLMVALPGMRLTAEAALKHQWIESYLSLAVQPSPLSQTTCSLPATDPTTEVLASWNSLSISDAPLPDFDKTLRPGNTENHQSADHCTVRPSLIEDVSRQVTRPEKFTHIRELRGHTGIVQSVAFSPNGATIASGSNDMSVRIWDASMGRQLQELKGHTGSVYSVAFSPNGATIVSGSADCSVRTWDTSTGRQLWEKPRAHASAVQSVAFSPKGTTIASAERSKNGSVKIWDTRTGRLLRELSVLGSFCAIAFSPKWATIASGEKSSNGSVRIWDARTGRQLRKLKGHNSGVKCLAFSPDGTTIASASGPGDCHMRIWDTSTGRQLWKHAFNWGFFGSVAFSPDGATIASGYTEGSTKGVLSIWDASTGERLQRKFSCHASSIDSVAFSPDGTTLVSGSTDGLVRIWDIYQV